MKLQLYNEVYKWVVSINVMKVDPRTHVVKSNGKTEIDDFNTSQFFNGVKVAEILELIQIKAHKVP